MGRIGASGPEGLLAMSEPGWEEGVSAVSLESSVATSTTATIRETTMTKANRLKQPLILQETAGICRNDQSRGARCPCVTGCGGGTAAGGCGAGSCRGWVVWDSWRCWAPQLRQKLAASGTWLPHCEQKGISGLLEVGIGCCPIIESRVIHSCQIFRQPKALVCFQKVAKLSAMAGVCPACAESLAFIGLSWRVCGVPRQP